MEFVVLDTQEYDRFARNHPYRNYLNSLYAFEVKRYYGYENHFVGVKKDGELLGAAAISLSPLMKFYRYAYAQRGFLIDFQDQELLSFFTEKLKSYLKKQNVIYLRMDPYVMLQQRDEDGAIIEEGWKNFALLSHLKTNGYHHQGFTTGFSSKSQVRWMMVLDLKDKSEAQIFQELNQRTRWSIRKAERLGVEIRELKEEELDRFYEMMEYTSFTRHFLNMPLSHYKAQREIFGSDRAKFLMAYLDCDKVTLRLQDAYDEKMKELSEVKQTLSEHPDSKKYRKKKASILEEMVAMKQQSAQIEQLKKKHGNIIDIATAYFILYENEIVYVSSGAFDEFRSFNGPYAIQWYMIKEALNQGIARYNFYGTSGIFHKDAPDYGVYLFKKGFHAHVEELIGDFILPIQPMKYRLYRRWKGKTAEL